MRSRSKIQKDVDAILNDLDREHKKEEKKKNTKIFTWCGRCQLTTGDKDGKCTACGAKK